MRKKANPLPIHFRDQEKTFDKLIMKMGKRSANLFNRTATHFNMSCRYKIIPHKHMHGT